MRTGQAETVDACCAPHIDLARCELLSEEGLSMDPCCVKCGGTEFTSKVKSFRGMVGYWIYCESCKAIVTWTPKLDK